MVNHINENKYCHIITIEDPVEYQIDGITRDNLLLRMDEKEWEISFLMIMATTSDSLGCEHIIVMTNWTPTDRRERCVSHSIPILSLYCWFRGICGRKVPMISSALPPA
jgi:hypothetical protein